MIESDVGPHLHSTRGVSFFFVVLFSIESFSTRTNRLLIRKARPFVSAFGERGVYSFSSLFMIRSFSRVLIIWFLDFDCPCLFYELRCVHLVSNRRGAHRHFQYENDENVVVNGVVVVVALLFFFRSGQGCYRQIFLVTPCPKKARSLNVQTTWKKRESRCNFAKHRPWHVKLLLTILNETWLKYWGKRSLSLYTALYFHLTSVFRLFILECV